MTPALAALMTRHAETIQRLMQAIAVERGLGDFLILSESTQAEIGELAAAECARWNDSPGLRERGPGDSEILRLVAEQYEIGPQILESEDLTVTDLATPLAGNPPRID